MGIEAELRAEFDRSERKEERLFRVLPYVLLAVSTVITVAQSLWEPLDHLPTILGLTVAAAAWLAWFRPGRTAGHWAVLHYIGLLALAAGLVSLAPWYGFFAWACYPQAFLCLAGFWRYAGATATAFIAAVAFLGGMEIIHQERLWGLWSAIGAISAVLAGALFHFAEIGDRRNDKQRQALVALEAALAENAGLHAQLLVQAREAGVLDERQRMAEEIHDTLAQGLTGIVTQLQAAEQALDERPALRRHLNNAMGLARESLTEARRSVHAVRPAALAEARLPDAIGDVARRWSEVNGVDAVVTTTGEARPMHSDVEVALLRTAQEALANVAKHARAGRVGLTLSYMEDQVTLDVRDDGVGFDPDAGRPAASSDGGFGLAGMRQRMQRLAGSLEIESEPGGGTAISATLPAVPAKG